MRLSPLSQKPANQTENTVWKVIVAVGDYTNCFQAQTPGSNYSLFAARYSIRYSILIPRRSISSRKASAGTSRSCKTAPRLLTAPVHIIWRTMDAGNAVVRIMALMSLLGS